MTIVSHEEYHNDLTEFLKRHGEFYISTSSLNASEYTKAFVCEDGAVFTEVVRLVWEDADITIHGLAWKHKVKLLQVEYFSTDGIPSKFYYERW